MQRSYTRSFAGKRTIAAIAALLMWQGACAGQQPDWLLVNGKILTLNNKSTMAEALAVRGDRIMAVGSDLEVRAAAGATGRVIDLGGRLVVPGLIDSHIHAIRAGLRYTSEVNWDGAGSIATAIDRLKQAARSSPPAAWIVVAGGWTPAQFAEGRRPTLAEVMEAAPGRRVYIQLFYRAALISAEGLEALAISSASGLPPGAMAERDEHGKTTGWINGNADAITALYARLPVPGVTEGSESTRKYLAALNRLGITGIIDPGGHNLAPEDYEALMRLAQAGGLTVRVAYSISAPRPHSALADLAQLTRLLPMGSGTSMLRFNGIGERVTWGLYNNDNPSEEQKDEFYRVARWAADRGLALTAHWNNDRSVHHLLDVLERVNRDTPIGGLRWSIAHLHDASQPSLARMKSLGVGWLVQNGMYFAAAPFIAARGEAITRSPPIKTAIDMGMAVGGGTDANRVMSHNPFVSLKWMTDGRTVDGLPTRGRAELIGREAALRLYTVGSAWFAFDEHERGSLEPGKLADLAVLDRDYLVVPAEEMASLRALLTMVGGRIVHAEQPFETLPR